MPTRGGAAPGDIPKVLSGISRIPGGDSPVHALYLCSCTDVTHGTKRNAVMPYENGPAAHFVCVRIGASFRPLLSRALRSVPFEIASAMNLVANASASG